MSQVELILWLALAVAFLIQLFYYVGFYSRILFYKNKITSSNHQPVSVIICAKNESENLKKFLPTVLTQNYSKYEVVVVNDRSQDDSEEVLEQFKTKYPHLKTTKIVEDKIFSHNKKLAITLGIKAAQYENLLFTDADCVPLSADWILSMQNNFSENTEIILGYGGYFEDKGFLNKLIRFETFFIALQYLTFALAKIPYMGVGRNLAYKKTLFFRNKGFATYAHLQSGDDDLFINKVATKTNTRIEINKESIVKSNPEETFEAWFRQKKRHITTGPLYKTTHKLLLSMELLSRESFYITLIALLFYTNYYYVILGVFLLRLTLQLIIFKIAMNRLHEKYLLLSSLLLDVALPYIYMVLAISNVIQTKKTRWK